MKQLSLSDFQFPESPSIERQVLSDAVFNADIFPDMMQLVSPDMFYNEAARKAWEMMVEMYNKGEVIDVATINGRMGREFSKLIFSDNITPGTGVAAMQHVSVLRDASAKRNAYRFAIHLLEASVKPEATEETIAMMLENAGEEIMSSVAETSAPLSKVVNEVSDEMERDLLLRREGKSLRIRTGFQSLDFNLYQGWGPGQLVILAARPSVGKTSLAMQFAMTAAWDGARVQIFTLEMTRQELLKKMLFSTELVNPLQMAKGETPWDAFERASGIISSLPISIDDKSRNLTDICSKIRREHNRGNCGIAFIDYLGLVRGVSREQRYREVADITGEFKALAKDLGIPIVVLCQLSRLIARENRPPELSDLRESGDIEQDADIVLMLERLDNGDLNLWIRKNRQFKKDFPIRLHPNDTYSKFYEITTDNIL